MMLCFNGKPLVAGDFAAACQIVAAPPQQEHGVCKSLLSLLLTDMMNRIRWSPAMADIITLKVRPESCLKMCTMLSVIAGYLQGSFTHQCSHHFLNITF